MRKKVRTSSPFASGCRESAHSWLGQSKLRLSVEDQTTLGWPGELHTLYGCMQPSVEEGCVLISGKASFLFFCSGQGQTPAAQDTGTLRGQQTPLELGAKQAKRRGQKSSHTGYIFPLFVTSLQAS